MYLCKDSCINSNLLNNSNVEWKPIQSPKPTAILILPKSQPFFKNIEVCWMVLKVAIVIRIKRLSEHKNSHPGAERFALCVWCLLESSLRWVWNDGSGSPFRAKLLALCLGCPSEPGLRGEYGRMDQTAFSSESRLHLSQASNSATRGQCTTTLQLEDTLHWGRFIHFVPSPTPSPSFFRMTTPCRFMAVRRIYC